MFVCFFIKRDRGKAHRLKIRQLKMAVAALVHDPSTKRGQGKRTAASLWPA